jgi:23S rRNA (cytidine1920-2'-O)/16S rRNA (cytidine1409-2'-O)-methyltransferase
LSLAAPAATLIALFKPQFEVGPSNVGKGGLVTDENATQSALQDFEQFLRASAWTPGMAEPSPVPGGDGNREWLVSARRQ